jgi:hypothetical protein
MTQDIIRLLPAYLRYEPETGKLFWKPRVPAMFEAKAYSAERQCVTWNAHYAGKEAFTADNGKGYRQGCIDGRHYFAHRVIWAIHRGQWPEFIDHIDGRRDNNRLENLRCVSRAENAKNMRQGSRNRSGVTGVHWDKEGRKWKAVISVQGAPKHIGYFKDLDEARAARREAEIAEGFHPNHGGVLA